MKITNLKVYGGKSGVTVWDFKIDDKWASLVNINKPDDKLTTLEIHGDDDIMLVRDSLILNASNPQKTIDNFYKLLMLE